MKYVHILWKCDETVLRLLLFLMTAIELFTVCFETNMISSKNEKYSFIAKKMHLLPAQYLLWQC